MYRKRQNSQTDTIKAEIITLLDTASPEKLLCVLAFLVKLKL